MTDLPPALQRLLSRLYARVDVLTSDLEAGTMEPTAWRDSMAAVLAQGHTAAYMTGQNSSDLAAADQRRLMRDLSAQLGFLDNFTVEIQGAAEFQKGWNARAQMYADAIKIPFWQGVTRLYPLPYMPAEGTQCLSNCRCLWEIQELDGDGNADCYWRRPAGDSCQTCVERERANPIRIRNGELL